MRKAAVALSLVVLGVASAFGAQQAPADWLKYSSPEGRYNVLFPAQPKLSAQDGTGATGEKFKQYIASANDDLSVYMIGYFDYTPPMTFSFDEGRNGMLKAVNGTLVSESAISLGGRPGRELKVAAKTADGLDFIVRARYYDAGGRVYLIQIVTRKTTEAAAYSDKATRFFDSFQVVTTP
jgi:hypothetical protein